MHTLQPTRIIVMLATIAMWWVVPTAAAQPERVTVEWHGEENATFYIILIGEGDSTREEAVERAMIKGCEATQGRGFRYYAVNSLSSTLETQQLRTSEGGTTYIGGQNGVVPDRIITEDEYGTFQFGTALLMATMTDEGGRDLLSGSAEIVDARTCRVYSRPPR